MESSQVKSCQLKGQSKEAVKKVREERQLDSVNGFDEKEEETRW